ncbi:hypothetical protein ACFL4T_07025 [candidate division KSB1 bacterium]
MINGEQDYIERCKNLIEKKLNWSDSRFWKQRDYEYLKEMIFEETGILLSLSTLKRLWKKEYESTPHPSTLDSLAVFIGCKNWNDFKAQIPERIPDNVNAHIEEKSEQNDLGNLSDAVEEVPGKKPLIFRFNTVFSAFIGIIAIFLVIIFIKPGQSGDNFDDILFTSKKAVSSGLPNTVIFNYDISKIKTDNVQIQQSWNDRKRVGLPKDENYYSSVYYFPGFHKAKLVVDGEIVKQHNLHITTDGWLGILRYSLKDEIPVYIPKEYIFQGDRLYVSPETLADKIDIVKNEYLLSFYNVGDFGDITGDNFSLEARVKNDLSEGAMTGQYVNIIVMCENGRHIIPLAHPGCVGNIGVKFLEKTLKGTNNDLSAFGCDLSDWNDLRCTVKEKQAKVFLNDKSVFEISYNNEAGRIIGLHFAFYGCGSVQNIKLLDTDKQIVYEDNFVRDQNLNSAKL